MNAIPLKKHDASDVRVESGSGCQQRDESRLVCMYGLRLVKFTGIFTCEWA
jgi:hypothetical protein